MSLQTTTKPRTSTTGRRSRKKKPQWDANNQDLTAFRLTPEEIQRRRESHRSKNLELIRQAALEKKIGSARRKALSDFTNRSNSTNAFLREILYDEKSSNQLLDDTQKALQVAHDIFGDDARKYKAIPAITTCDGYDEADIQMRTQVPDGLIRTTHEPQTKLDKLSESVTRKVALNETFSASESEDDEDEVEEGHTTPVSSNYPVRMDLQRFQRLLEKEDLSTIASEMSENVDPNQKSLQQEVQKATLQSSQQKEQLSDIPSKNRSSKKKKVAPPSFDSNDLKTLTDRLERTLSGYEAENGISKSEMSTAVGLSSYTVQLIHALQRMMSYLQQMKSEMTEEARKRKILEQQLADQERSYYCLTSELSETQEQLMYTLDELKHLKVTQQEEIDNLKATVARMSKGGAIHTVLVDEPNPVVSQVKDTIMQKSPAPVIVRAHAEYDDSPEQVKVLSHIPPNQKISGTGHTTAECSKPVVKAIPEMSLEERIEQLRGDHKQTVERFRRLGAELQGGGVGPAPSWTAE